MFAWYFMSALPTTNNPLVRPHCIKKSKIWVKSVNAKCVDDQKIMQMDYGFIIQILKICVLLLSALKVEISNMDW